MNFYNVCLMKKILAIVGLLVMFFSTPVFAQQFVTDDYFVMPYKSSNLVIVAGDNFATLIPSMGLFPKWEIFTGVNLIYEDDSRQGENHFSGLFFAKNNVWENARQTGGVSWTFGTGLNPDYYQETVPVDSFRDVFGLINWTIPMAKDKVQLDINPGFSTKTGDAIDGRAWDFTYAARIAWIKGIGDWTPIAEIFGAEGDVGADPQYKIGFRWEPNDNFRFAVTYGGSFDGSDSSGFQVGFITVTLPCEKGCSPF